MLNAENVNYNVEEISNILGLDTETILKLADMLLKKTNITNEKLKEAIKQMDYSNIIMLSHDIKGSCANLRLMKISELALEIEKMAKDNNVDSLVCLEICNQIENYIKYYSSIIN